MGGYYLEILKRVWYIIFGKVCYNYDIILDDWV